MGANAPAEIGIAPAGIYIIGPMILITWQNNVE